MRYAMVKNNKISSISNEPIKSIDCIEISDELSKIDSRDLIINAKVKDGKIVYKYLKKPTNQLKVALVSNYGSQCGLGTYAKFLYDELVGYVGDYKSFIEQNDSYEVENPKIPNDKIVPCWKRGEKLSELIEKIKEYEPDIIHINHEYGLFPDARHWLSLLTQLQEYRVIVTMHSVFPHHQDKIICEAAIPEIIVHLEGAKTNLKEEKKVLSKVYVIPHGCYSFSEEHFWNLYKSEHVFFTCGFGFRYKNFENSIIATSILKEKYPDIFFTAIFSESPHNKEEHQLYYNSLIELIDKLKIKDHIAIVRGFQSNIVIDSYLRTNKAAVFPYTSDKKHEVFGSSGASRLALSANIPVITSSIHHFSDLPSIKADTPEEIAAKLDEVFSNPEIIKTQLEKQKLYVQENSWQNIALKYLEIFSQ